MRKKFEINRTKIKGGCQSERKVVPHVSKSDLPLFLTWFILIFDLTRFIFSYVFVITQVALNLKKKYLSSLGLSP